jgi:DNA modification methylase
VQPYYDDGSVTIYHGDCREFSHLRGDVTITDPPYGVGKAAWDSAIEPWYLPVAAKFSPLMGAMVSIKSLLLYPTRAGALWYRWTMAVHLINGMTTSPMGYGNWLPCLIYGPNEAEWCSRFANWCSSRGITRRALDTAAGTSDMGGWWASNLPHRAQIPTPEQWAKLRVAFDPPRDFDDGVHASSWEMNTDIHDVVVGREPKPAHPSPKPLPAVSWFMSRLPGNTVIDPFMGSGTTLVAAKNLGRRAIGIEIEERYCEEAARRLGQGVLPLHAA